MKLKKNYLLLILALFVSSSCSFAQLESTDLDYAKLQTEYNAVKDKHVILSILGVNCPNCLGHRNQIRDQIMKDCENPDLQWFIVWFEDTDHPATRADAVTQAANVSDSRVKQWWYKEHSSSTPKNDSICHKFGTSPWLGCAYPWDISVLFRKGIPWTGKDAPFPAYCMSRTSCCNIYNITKFKDELEKKSGCDTGTSHVLPFESELGNGLELSPNPAENTVQLRWSSELLARQIKIYSIAGELVYEEDLLGQTGSKKVVDLSQWQSGIYMVQFQSSQGVTARRLVVQ